MTSNEVITIFKEAVKETGLNNKQIAKETGLSESTISRIMNNENKYVTYVTANKIVKYLKLKEVVNISRTPNDTMTFNIFCDNRTRILKHLDVLEAEIKELRCLLV